MGFPDPVIEDAGGSGPPRRPVRVQRAQYRVSHPIPPALSCDNDGRVRGGPNPTPLAQGARVASSPKARSRPTREASMRIRRIAISAAFIIGLAALPPSTAKAQYYAPCSPFPLAWPFCVAGAVVGAAATIATAPFWLLSGMPYYGYYGSPYYPAPSYAQGYYPPPYSTYVPPPAAALPATPRAPEPLTAPPPHSQASHPPPPVRDGHYYYCPASKSYYPYVASCAVAWRPVPTTPPRGSEAR